MKDTCIYYINYLIIFMKKNPRFLSTKGKINFKKVRYRKVCKTTKVFLTHYFRDCFVQKQALGAKNQ